MVLVCRRCQRQIRGTAAAEKVGSLGEIQVICRRCFKTDSKILQSKIKVAKSLKSEGFQVSEDLVPEIFTRENPKEEKKMISKEQMERHRRMEVSKAEPGKFEGGFRLDREVHYATLDGTVSTVGDVETTGHYSYLSYSDLLDVAKDPKADLNAKEREFLNEQRAAIVYEDSNGFVTVDYFKDETTAERRFVAIEKEISDAENPNSEFKKRAKKFHDAKIRGPSRLTRLKKERAETLRRIEHSGPHRPDLEKRYDLLDERVQREERRQPAKKKEDDFVGDFDDFY